MFENLEHKHLSGLYRSKLGNEFLFYQQKPELDPPSFFSSKSTNKKGSKTNSDIELEEDSVYLENYCNQIIREHSLTRNNKRKRDFRDEVDDIFKNLKALDGGIGSTL